MLVAIVYLVFTVGGFSIEDFQNIKQIPPGAANSFCLWRFSRRLR